MSVIDPHPFQKTDNPELKAIRRKNALANLQKAYAATSKKRELRLERIAHFVALNPFASVPEICREGGLSANGLNKVKINNLLSQPMMREKIAAYKQEYVNPIVTADIGERYRTLAIQAVEKAQARLYDKDCKDNTLVEILRVCSQYLAPKNAAVQINAASGSLVGILSDMQSSAQEALQKQEKVIESE